MTLDAVRKTFTDWSPIYDATHSWLPKRREARLTLGVQRGDRVLDLACGTGLNFSHLRELVGEEGHVVGVDLTPAMLALANRRIAQHDWKNVETREADAARLSFADASFDKAICAFALNIIPNYVGAIEEIKRVLMPGGRFVSLEMQSMMHSIPQWLQPVPHICAVDVTRRTVDELRRVFPKVQVQKFWLGTFFIAVVAK